MSLTVIIKEQKFNIDKSTSMLLRNIKEPVVDLTGNITSNFMLFLQVYQSVCPVKLNTNATIFYIGDLFVGKFGEVILQHLGLPNYVNDTFIKREEYEKQQARALGILQVYAKCADYLHIENLIEVIGQTVATLIRNYPPGFIKKIKPGAQEYAKICWEM